MPALPAEALPRLADASLRLLVEASVPLAEVSLRLLARGSVRAPESAAREHRRCESAEKGQRQ